jgi:hypothetical protein
VVQERRVGLLESDPHGVAVDRLDRLDGIEPRPEGGLGHESLERVLDVVRGGLAPVDRRRVVKLDAAAELEGVHGAVLRHGPPLG